MPSMVVLVAQTPDEGSIYEMIPSRVYEGVVAQVEDHPSWQFEAEDRADFLLEVEFDQARLHGHLTDVQFEGRAEQVRFGQLLEVSPYIVGESGSVMGAFGAVLSSWLNKYADGGRQHNVQLHRVFIEIEILVSDIQTALDENEYLRERLREARIEIDFLRQQLNLVSQSLSVGRPKVVRWMLGAVGAILLATTTGVSEGVAGTVAGHLAEGGNDETSVVELIERCDTLADQLESIEATFGDG